LLGSSGPLQNTTPSVGITPPGGASNIATSQAFAAFSVLNGPVGLPAATASYPAAPNNGSAAASNMLDFTAVGFACSNGATINSGSFTCSVPAADITVPNSFENFGNATDTFTLTAQAPAGYTVQLFNATCPVGPYGFILPTCTIGTQITGVSSPGGSIGGSAGSVTSGGTVNYVAVYKNASAVAPWVGVDSDITVTGSNAETNDTHDDLYPGSVVKLTKSLSILSNGCPTGASPAAPAGMVCPSGIIQYAVAYANVAPASVAPGGSNAGTEPSWALAGITTGGPGSRSLPLRRRSCAKTPASCLRWPDSGSRASPGCAETRDRASRTLPAYSPARRANPRVSRSPDSASQRSTSLRSASIMAT
jgi:hypothetical protein